MKNVVIAGYARSPFHLANKGELTKVRPDDLAATVVKALLERTGVDGAAVEDLIVGCAFPEGEQGFNVAKLIAMIAGLPASVAGATVNRFCGSSMQAIHQAAGAIALGAGDCFIAAGVESMTRVPMMGFNPMPNPALHAANPGAYMSMGITAENLAKKFGFTRAQQEAFAVESHRKAAKAQAEGKFEAEIVPITTPSGKVISQDGCIRGDSTVEALSTLKPAFDAAGTVTAGTSSPLTDGASATLICSEDFAKAHGLKVLAKIRSIAVAGCDPTIMGYGPVPATTKALARAGLKVSDLDIIESNEAFAVQAMTVCQELGFDPAKVNIDGGGIAMGHPLGATGARITGKAASLLVREGKSLALSTQCIGGGQGIATVLEAV
ncbi:MULTISPECIES: thiolase family protein [Azospirillaceae]|jgi:acetyl-CoA acyltransferase|uniref:thiolase family protein n=1 Tax=Azospirillaceae TaxID=2829815 RepID=UPI000B654954|nr:MULTISPECIES: thiolase family protein [Azospirillaceae]MDG5494142.1 thiolase family protein [Niveispirillum sp. BGYR6]SNR99586.1 acetyl-CoA acyltransferase [Azospirillum sp. RU38E]SNS17097.1 acetyl-CoA acyltransferase [Azospirillum sp. RU37A]